MEVDPVPWPHAPVHRLSECGTYFVTAATYGKAHLFRSPQRLAVLQRGLLRVTADFEWQLEAWAVFSNHYHFVAKSPRAIETADSLTAMLSMLHARLAGWVNRLDATPGRKVWFNYWDTRLTYQRSYLARLNYVHQNAVHHELVQVPSQYPWCSARWLERIASPATVSSICRFRLDTVHVRDDFVVSADW